jgi:hypothetical protein
MYIERRSCLRHKVHGPVFASFDGVTGGMILDLSEQGLSMQSSVPLKADRRVQLQFDLPLRETASHDLEAQREAHLDTYFETTGYIAWADALGRAGVRFSELPPEARQRLDQWLAINDETPSQKAPTLNFDRAVGRAQMGAAVGNEAGKTRSISLEAESVEAESAAENPGSAVSGSNISGSDIPGSNISGSNTVQYEFHSLGSDLNAALRIIGDRARSLLRGTGAAIALIDRGPILRRIGFESDPVYLDALLHRSAPSPMLCRASVGTGGPPLGTRVDVNSGFTGACIRSGRALRCDDTETDSRVVSEVCRKLGVRSIAAAPIRYEREVVGLVEVFSSQSFAFDEGDLAILERLAQTAILVVSQSHLLEHS